MRENGQNGVEVDLPARPCGSQRASAAGAAQAPAVLATRRQADHSRPGVEAAERCVASAKQTGYIIKNGARRRLAAVGQGAKTTTAEGIGRGGGRGRSVVGALPICVSSPKCGGSFTWSVCLTDGANFSKTAGPNWATKASLWTR